MLVSLGVDDRCGRTQFQCSAFVEVPRQQPCALSASHALLSPSCQADHVEQMGIDHAHGIFLRNASGHMPLRANALEVRRHDVVEAHVPVSRFGRGELHRLMLDQTMPA